MEAYVPWPGGNAAASTGLYLRCTSRRGSTRTIGGLDYNGPMPDTTSWPYSTHASPTAWSTVRGTGSPAVTIGGGHVERGDCANGARHGLSLAFMRPADVRAVAQ